MRPDRQGRRNGTRGHELNRTTTVPYRRPPGRRLKSGEPRLDRTTSRGDAVRRNAPFLSARARRQIETVSKEAAGSSAAAARGQIVGDTGEVDELAREGDEAVDVGDESERGADGAAGGKPDRFDIVVDRHCIAELAADERFARDREGDLTGAGVAEAAGSERDVVPTRHAVDIALVDDPSVRVEEVEGDRRAASVEVAGAVDRGGRSAVCVSERSERVE